MRDAEKVRQDMDERVPSQEIESILDSKLERPGNNRKVVEKIEEYNSEVVTSGGKRVRVALPYLMAKGLDVRFDDSEIIEALMPIEILHGVSLILDDIIDQDRIRRGMETPHEKFKLYDYSKHNAESVTMLDVTHMQSIAVTLSYDMDFLSPEQQIEISRVIQGSVSDISRSQILDVSAEELHNKESKDLLEYEGGEFNYGEFYSDIVTGKTVSLFKAGPAILEILTGKQLNQLSGYAEELGKAYQIRDDVIDISAGEEKISITQEDLGGESIGKDCYSDLQEGSMTLPIHYALETMENKSWSPMKNCIREMVGDPGNNLGSKDDIYGRYKDRKQFLEQIIAKDRPKNYELQLAAKIIEDTGALEKANKEALDHAEKAAENLKKSNVTGEYEDILTDIAYYAATRSK